MPYPTFDELPFNSRPDLSPYLVHLTKNTRKEDESSAFDNLVNILKTGRILGSTSDKGFIKGPRRAACFMDIPFYALKYVLTPENVDPQKPRYEAFGIFITKKYAYNNGCRPVLYLSNQEVSKLGIPKEEQWRVVRFEVTKEGWISWLHEREWRCKGSFLLPSKVQGVLVKNTSCAQRLQALLAKDGRRFRCKPKSIIPLTIICQGLLKPNNL